MKKEIVFTQEQQDAAKQIQKILEDNKLGLVVEQLIKVLPKE